MNYYNFHIGDWVLHTNHLTLEEEAVYRRLIDYYYQTEKPIPEETQSVIRRLRLGNYSDTVRLILEEFFTLEDNGWHNKRVDAELNRYKNRVSTAKENGKKGGRPKQKQEVKTKSVNSANQAKSQTKTNQEPITNNQEPITNLSFDDFYDGYDYKNSRGQAERAWKKLSGEDKQKAIDAAPRDAKYHHNKNRIEGKDKNAFRQLASTWLNAQGWDNELDTPEDKGKLDTSKVESWRLILGGVDNQYMMNRNRNSWPEGEWGPNPWTHYNAKIPAEIRAEYAAKWNWKVE